MGENHAQSVLNRIRKECITPESRFKVCWKNYMFWTISILMALIGSLFLSFAFTELSDLDSQVFRKLRPIQFIRLVFATAPYFWFAFVAVATALGVWAFRSTRRSYRFSALLVAGTTIFAVSTGAFALNIWKVNEQIEEGIAKGMPALLSMKGNPLEGRWSRPEEGLLGGKVENVDASRIVIFSFDGKLWTVVHTSETRIHPDTPINIGEIVKIIGNRTGQETFHADIIRHRAARILEQKTRPWRDCASVRERILQTYGASDVYDSCGFRGKLAPEGSAQ